MSNSQEKFTIDPALNLPYGGGAGSKLDRARLRLLKRELKENPDAEYIKSATREFIPAMRPTLSKIPPGSNLIIMPSTSGFNSLPADLAVHLKKERPDLQLINAKHQLIKTSHAIESKIKGDYSARAMDPRQFEFNEKKLSRLAAQNRPSYIVDDSISTGESAIVLQRQLSKRGIYAQGVIAAVSGEHYHTRVSDLDRVYGKLTENYPTDYSAK